MDKREDGMKIFSELMPNIKETGKQPKSRVASELGGLSLEYVFGTLWARPELDRRSRSLVTLGILIAQKNGITKDEIDEIIYQSSAYAGFPAASEAAHSAQQVFDEQERGNN